MGVPLYVTCHFSLAAFNNFSLSLIFASLITMCLSVFLLGFILPAMFSVIQTNTECHHNDIAVLAHVFSGIQLSIFFFHFGGFQVKSVGPL